MRPFRIWLVLMGWVALVVLVGSCAHASELLASYYGSESGTRTASGQRFRPMGLTAAHRTWAFGTVVRVCLRGCAVVVVNDRGPFVRGRELDLSLGAAQAIGLVRRGRGSGVGGARPVIRLSPAATLYHADCRETLRALPSDSLDSCVTDPPYNLNFMGKAWDTSEVAMDVDFWKDVLRVLKPGAFLCAFGASRQYHRMACAIEDAGFEIRDSLMWVYGTGFPKSHDVSKGVDRIVGGERDLVSPPSVIGHQRNIGNVRPYMLDPDHKTVSNVPASPEAAEWEGWGTALKPAFEPIVLARKPLSEGTVAANVLRWRTGALNIGASRIPTDPSVDDPRLGGNGSWTTTKAQSGDTVSLPRGTVASSAAGRWPANVVHDGSDEVVGAFPTSSVTGKRSAKSKAAEVDGTNWLMNNHESTEYTDAGSAARFFYSAKASRADRNGSKHPTVKPIALMEWLATLITPPGGTVLDPFAGSGTTGIAATRRGFQVILCEREAEYVADIRARFSPSERPRIVIDLAAFRRETVLQPHLDALQARLAARG